MRVPCQHRVVLNLSCDDPQDALSQCLVAMQLDSASNAALSAPVFDFDADQFVVGSDISLAGASTLDLAFISVHDRALTNAEVSTMYGVARASSSACPSLAVGATPWCSLHSLLVPSGLVCLHSWPLFVPRHDVLMQLVCGVAYHHQDPPTFRIWFHGHVWTAPEQCRIQSLIST